jgi:plastocyanin
MRFIGVALVSSAVVLGACGGGEKKPETAAAVPAAAAAAAPAATGPVTVGTPAPITGKTVEIKMIGDAQGYRFEPKDVTINAGDALKFTVVGGGPHNVAFDATKLPADVRAQLDANYGADKMAELSSNLKMNPGDNIVISFGKIKPGTYEFNCTPHLAMNMKGTVTVK